MEEVKMNPKAMAALNAVQTQISSKIRKYADKHGITYEEAAKRARLTVGGVEIMPFTKGGSSGICKVSKREKSGK